MLNVKSLLQTILTSRQWCSIRQDGRRLKSSKLSRKYCPSGKLNVAGIPEKDIYAERG